MKVKIDKTKIIIRDFTIPLLVTDRTNRKLVNTKYENLLSINLT
jgi:hypothetical protein